jgi:hypothetical protein
MTSQIRITRAEKKKLRLSVMNGGRDPVVWSH